MYILALDTSTATLALALLDDRKVLAEGFWDLGVNHSQVLLPALEGMLKVAGLTIGQIELFACTIGPGSFTGIRIGISTIKGFALATGRPIAGISTLDALAGDAATDTMMVCPMLDARKGQVYAALYKPDEAGLEKLAGDQLTEVGPFVRAISREVLFLGDGALCHARSIQAVLGSRAHFAAPHRHHVSASSVGLLGLQKYLDGEFLDPLTFTPRYLRLSEAEARGRL
ncbi:MAG: tRNA (adenosine(37)-N6)-threonylcarbamoyltransferase complex dimerization subunit type 1 TsaB [Deltaproteobacteria bacterium]|nr:tRNA (adenosine(37)-N6)-threonylcarbamoyltransferase complex dimerization subunit type 1 TsaB [Deltaproteobacteria bacterium]